MDLTWIIVLSVLAFLSVGFVVSYVIVNRLMFAKFFKRAKDEDIMSVTLEDAYYDECRDEMKSAAKKLERLPYEIVTTTAKDGILLSAKHYCRGKDKLIVLVHGVHSYPPYCFGVFALEAYDKGYDLLIIDQRAHWQSGGQYITYGNKESQDLLCWLEKIDNVSEIFCFGISMGAATLGFASDKICDPRVKALVMDCGYTSTRSLIEHLLGVRGVPKFLFKPTMLWGKTADAMTSSTEDCLKNTKIPVMFVHGDADVVVPVSETTKNYEACASKKDLEIVPNAGHGCATIIGGEKLRTKIFDFLGGTNE